MKMKVEDGNSHDFSLGKLHPQTNKTVSLRIPVDTLRSIEQVAASRDMSVNALLKFYIGQCLRQDLDRLFGERVLAATTGVLKKRLSSEDEVTEIMESIHRELSHAA